MVLTLANVSISGETGDGEITNDFIEETREKKSEMPNILLESFEGNFPSIYLNKTEENSLRTSQDESSELSVSVTSGSFETSSVSEINNNFDERNNSVTRMDDSSGGIVENDDVITDDVTGGDVTSDDVTSSDIINDDVISDNVKSSDAISNDVSNDDVKGDKNVVANDVIGEDLIRSDVIDDDIIPINTGECVNSVSKSIDNDSCVDPSDKLSESMESNEVRTKCEQLACDNPPLARAHIEITITEDNSTVQQDFIDISNLCDEKNVAKSDGKHSNLSENIIAEAQDEQTFIKKGVEEKGGGCKCFHKTKDIASEEQHQNKYIEDKSVVGFRQIMNSPDVTRTNMDSKESYGISERSNLSNTIQDSPEVTDTSEDNSVEKLENISFASKTPLLTTSSNTVDNFDSNEQSTEDESSEPKNHDSSQSPVNKPDNSKPFHGNLLQSNFKTLDSTENVNISINCTSSENTDANEMSHAQNNIDSLENSSNVSLSKVEDRTSQNISDDGIFDKNKIPQNAVEISSSDVKLSKLEERTIFDVSETSFSDDSKIHNETSYINDNIDDNNFPKESTNTATVENTPKLHDVRILTVENPDILESIKSERNFLRRSVRERTSSANSFASSDFSVESDGMSSFADEQEPLMADDEMDLSSKAGMDKFKEFLMDTKGEALLLFWLEVETWKHIGDSGDKMRCVVGLCGSFSQLN